MYIYNMRMKLFFNLFFIIAIMNWLPIFAQSTDEIINNHIAAIGGNENWEKIKSLKIEGTLKGDIGHITITKRILKGKAIRNDLQMHGRTSIRNDKKYYVILNGKNGWKYMPDNKNNTILSLYESEITQLEDELDYEDPFINYLEKGRVIHMVGIEYYNEKEFYKFLIEYKSGKKIYCYMDVNSLMIDKTVLIEAEVDDIREYKNYEKLPAGIWIAKQVITLSGELNITSVEINPNFLPDVFLPSNTNKFNYK